MVPFPIGLGLTLNEPRSHHSLTLNISQTANIRPIEANRKLHQSFRIWQQFQWPWNQISRSRYIIQRHITRPIVSRDVWSIQCFRFQWPRVTLNLYFKVTGQGHRCHMTYCVRTWRAIAKFLFHTWVRNGMAILRRGPT